MKKERALYNEPQLLKLLAEGDRAAFRQLYRHCAPNVYKTALKFLKSPARAEDLVQDIFITVWTKRGDFMHVENMRSYLGIMSKNLALRHLMRLVRESEATKEWLGDHPVRENSTERQVDKSELEDLLRKTVDMLPAQQKQVYHLAQMEGLSYEAIAGRLQISTNTVKGHLVKANDFIRNRLRFYSTPLSVLLLFILDELS